MEIECRKKKLVKTDNIRLLEEWRGKTDLNSKYLLLILYRIIDYYRTKDKILIHHCPHKNYLVNFGPQVDGII
jgi:hypothetical protein